MSLDTELTITVTDPAGNTSTLDSHAPDPKDRPQGLTFSTQQGTGFATASFTLSCPIDYERDDVGLLYDVKVTGAGGDTAYEGFIAAMPRSMDGDGQASLTITCAGYMATATGKSFTEIFVDRDLSRWTGASRERITSLLTSSPEYTQPEGPSIAPDSATGQATLILRTADQWDSPVRPISEAWYDGGESGLGVIYYNIENEGSAGAGDATWDVVVRTTDADDFSSVISSTGDMWPPPDSAYMDVTGRYAVISFFNTDTPGGLAGYTYSVHVGPLAIYGPHGLPRVGDEDPGGVAASDVMRYLVGRYCPLLNADGVQDTTYPIHQLTFVDLTKPYDAFLKVNSYHQLPLGVWENRTLHFGPATDLSDYDFEIRHDEVGNTIGLQGDEYTDLRSRIVVQYTDVATGRMETLRPEDHAELRDESPDSPFNVAGWEWDGDPFTVPFPTTQANALELGRIQLIEDNQPKAPGSFTVQYRIKDRAGVEQPVWKVRAGHRIKLTSSVSLSERPRLIGETNFSNDGKTITITVDGTSRVLEAYLDRVQTRLSAEGL